MGGNSLVKVLIFADFRSPHARGWADGLEEVGIQTLRVASLGEPTAPTADVRRGAGQQMARRLPATAGHRIRTAEAVVRQVARRSELRRAVAEFRPHIVHALRVPYEGVSALAAVGNEVPVVVSTWGQDFVAQAASDSVLRAWIRRVLPHAAGLIADVPEDLSRARTYGLPGVPTAVAAANFGMAASPPRRLPVRSPMVTYIRGVAPHINYLEFLAAIPEIVAHARTDIRFTGIGLAALPEGRELAADRAFGARINLTDKLNLLQFSEVIRASVATCSPATSDGMPISVLSSLAEGRKTLVAPLPQYADMARQTESLVLMGGADRSAIAEAVLALDEQWAVAEAGEVTTSPFVPEAYDRARNAQIVPDFYDQVLRARS
jgi:hypothetical protein